MKFYVWDEKKQTNELLSMSEMTLQQYSLTLRDLDWGWWTRDPEKYSTGEVAMREAYLTAEVRGQEFQQAFRREFIRHNPAGLAPFPEADLLTA